MFNEFKGTKDLWKRDKYGHVVDESGRDIIFRSMSSLCSGSEDRMAEAEANTTLAAAAPHMLSMLLKARYWAQMAGTPEERRELADLIHKATSNSN